MYIAHAGSGAGRVIHIVCAIAIMALVAFANLPSSTLFWKALQDFAHAPAFFALSIIGMTLYPLRTAGLQQSLPYLFVFLTCFIAGMGIETLQSLMGRDASVQDAVTDILGSVGGLATHAWRTTQSPRTLTARLWLVIGVIAIAAAGAPLAWISIAYVGRAQHFPVLTRFTNSLDLAFISGMDREPEIRRLPARLATSNDDRALYVPLSAHSYAGVSIDEPISNWSNYRMLAVELANPMDFALNLRIRVHDRAHNQLLNDRFNRSFEVPANSRVILRIPLPDIRFAPATRRLDMQQVAGIGIFTAHSRAEAAFYLKRVWLE